MRFFSSRHGFFAFAAIVSFVMLLVIEQEHRWVAIGLGTLYAILALLFYLEELGLSMEARRRDDKAGR